MGRRPPYKGMGMVRGRCKQRDETVKDENSSGNCRNSRNKVTESVTSVMVVAPAVGSHRGGGFSL